LTELPVPDGCEPGAYRLFASSQQAVREWETFSRNAPDALRVAYRRLSSTPRQPTNPARQFPLRGKGLRGVWQYEITASDRLYYVVESAVVVLTVIVHAVDSAAASRHVERRKRAHERGTTNRRSKAGHGQL
jgi:hypothetical protein